jgi:dCTP deaminase
MILPAQHIRNIRPSVISPFCERTIHNGMSFGLSSAGYDICIAEQHRILPGGFALGSSMEQFCMPNDVLAIVHDKSSWGRKGLAVQNTVIEPGWCGFLTLELSNNHDENTLFINPGDPIAQIVFHRLEAPTEQPYMGKYQHQAAGPQEAIQERAGEKAIDLTGW